MDSAQWPQVVVKSMEEEEAGIRRPVVERKAAKPGKKDQILNCPRCNSNNTKFCYYNNYSLSQPRYFCKSCRRYWTAGGSLRNIPVGGASRKNKRPSANFSSAAAAPHPSNNNISSPKNNKINDIGDDHDDQSNPIIIINGSSKLSNMINASSSSNSNSNATTSCCWLSSDHMNQMLRSNGMSQRELIPFMPMPAAAPQSTSICTTVADHCNPSRNMNNNGLFEGEGGEAARRLFSSTVEDFKQLPTIISADQNGEKLGDVPAFWNGIFGGGSW